MGDNTSKPEQPAVNQPVNDQSSPDPDPSPEPAFQLEPGRKNISYYWIDRRVYNAQNQMCYNYFRKQFRMEIFTSIDGLRFVLDQGPPQHMVKVLTAAGLPDEDFRYLHNEPKVAEVFLYCANEERAKLLMRNFSKIADFGLRKEQVAEKMRAAEDSTPKQTTPITEDLIGKRAEGINSGTVSTENKAQQATTAGTATNVSSKTVNVNNSVVGVSLQPNAGNVNQSSVIVNMSAVNVNMNPPVNVNQSSVVVNMSPVNVNQSSVMVNLQPPKPVNINNSTVDVVL